MPTHTHPQNPRRRRQPQLPVPRLEALLRPRAPQNTARLRAASAALPGDLNRSPQQHTARPKRVAPPCDGSQSRRCAADAESILQGRLERSLNLTAEPQRPQRSDGSFWGSRFTSIYEGANDEICRDAYRWCERAAESLASRKNPCPEMGLVRREPTAPPFRTKFAALGLFAGNSCESVSCADPTLPQRRPETTHAPRRPRAHREVRTETTHSDSTGGVPPDRCRPLRSRNHDKRHCVVSSIAFWRPILRECF